MSRNNDSNLADIILKSENGIRIRIKVSPGASRTKVIGLYGNALKVSLNAPPEKGKANQALIKLMEKVLGVPKQQISIITGQTSKQKVIEIKNIDISSCITNIKRIL